MISLFLVVLAAACYDEEKDKEESSDDGSPEIIFTTTCTCRLNLGSIYCGEKSKRFTPLALSA